MLVYSLLARPLGPNSRRSYHYVCFRLHVLRNILPVRAVMLKQQREVILLGHTPVARSLLLVPSILLRVVDHGAVLMLIHEDIVVIVLIQLFWRSMCLYRDHALHSDTLRR